jgi:ferritin-like metal-binding protein YciE
MPVNSLQDLYQQKLQMILDAEQQGLQAYPQMLGMVQHQELRQAMQTHMQQTQQQVQQLQQLAQQGGQSMQGGQPCVSMQALIQEAQQVLGQIQDPDTRDAFLICSAQAIEHHEIAAYGTARAWARELGRDQDVQVLEQILDQEKQTDALLTQLAERRVNQEAAQGAGH